MLLLLVTLSLLPRVGPGAARGFGLLGGGGFGLNILMGIAFVAVAAPHELAEQPAEPGMA